MSTHFRFLVIGASVALGTTLLLSAQQAPPQSDVVVNPVAGNPAAIQAGAKIFDQICAQCHGTAGVGDARGPALNSGTFQHGGDDADVFHTIRNGVPRTEMDANPDFSDEQVWQLVAYIKSLSAGSRPAASSAPVAITGDAAAGETLFYGKAQCSTCHEVNGRGGIVGPDLSTIGQSPVAMLRQKIVDPNAAAAQGGGGRGQRGGGAGGFAPAGGARGAAPEGAPAGAPDANAQAGGPPAAGAPGGGGGGGGGRAAGGGGGAAGGGSAAAGGRAAGGRAGGGGGGRGGAGGGSVTVIVTDKAGKEIRGIRKAEDTFSLQMIDATGQYHFIDKQSVADVRVDPMSLMPVYGNTLTPAEIDNVVAYLATLRQAKPAVAADISGGMGFDRLLKAASEPQNWPMFWQNYEGTHYSGLKQITSSNVHSLQAVWATPIPGDSILEGTPLVVDGIMYVTGSGNPLTVTALDPRTGKTLWRYTREQPVRNPYENNRYNRGVAILGNRLFVGTLDAELIALDARSGAVLWQVQMADTMEGYELTSPPVVVKNEVIMGISGGEYAIRGFVDAYDATTGKRLWRFYTIPGPGELGNDTWKDDSWQKGGGAAWLTPTYDPELNQVYIPVGNPAPQQDRGTRGDGLDNLFSCSVVALNADTGKRVWHYQFTPNDGHDWDSAEDMILVDRMWHGQNRKLLLHADRNGEFYVLDRTNGKFLQATPFVYQNWNTGFDPNGRPITVPGWNSSPEGSRFVYPALGGGTNFQAPSYSAATGYLYLEYQEGGGSFASGPAVYEKGRQYNGRGQGRGGAQRQPGEPNNSAGVKALDPETGKTVWDFKLFAGSLTNGLMATAGNVVFASIRDGNMAALDAKTGKPLWHFQTGANMVAAPMSYSVAGRQFVILPAGNFLYAFALPEAAQ